MSVVRGGLLWAAIVAAPGITCGLAAARDGEIPYLQLKIGGHPVRWLSSDRKSPVVLSYAIADREVDQPGATNCRRIGPPDRITERSSIAPDAFRLALENAVRRWRDVADITFVEAEPGSKADIIVGEQLDPMGYAFTNVEVGAEIDTPGAVRPITQASICLNPERTWKIGYDGNLASYDLVHTLTHEIGHAIGLDHPGSRGQLMSFRYTEDRDGLMEGDQVGAIAIYGPSRLYSTFATSQSTTEHAAPIVTSTIGRSLSSSVRE